MTPEEARVAWVEALRSGDYEQGKNHLRYHYAKHDEYCCLGVACELAIADGVEVERVVPEYGPVSYDENVSALPAFVLHWLGLRDDLGHARDATTLSLSWMNDKGVPFAKIADAIENTPEAYFLDNEEAV